MTYKVMLLNGQGMKALDAETVERACNSAAQDGWELTNAAAVASSGGVWLFFKRA